MYADIKFAANMAVEQFDDGSFPWRVFSEGLNFLSIADVKNFNLLRKSTTLIHAQIFVDLLYLGNKPVRKEKKQKKY